MSTSEWISHNDAREIIGRAIYRDDWIGSLTEEEIEILTGDFGPKRFPRPNGARGVFEIIDPCPKDFRNRLDAALGRDRRMHVQLGTVLEWLDKNRFGALEEKYPRAALESAAAQIPPPSTTLRTPDAGTRGPIKGTIARFAEHDRSMFPQMKRLIDEGKRLIDEGMSATEAALQLADQLKPPGPTTTLESKATRLRKLFQAEGR
jgi:hypothetical protein